MSDEVEERSPLASSLAAVPAAAAAGALARRPDVADGSFEVSREQFLDVTGAVWEAFSAALIDEFYQSGCTIEWSYDHARETFMFRWWRR